MDLDDLIQQKVFTKTLVAKNVANLSGDPISLTITIDDDARKLDRIVSKRTTRTVIALEPQIGDMTGQEVRIDVDRYEYAIGMIPLVTDWAGITNHGKAIPYDAALLKQIFESHSQPGELAFWFANEVVGALRETADILTREKDRAEKN
jgi:hypothetical protein